MIIEYTTLLSLLVLSARSAPTDAYVDSLNNTGLAIPEARASGAVALMGRNIHHETTTTLSTEYVDDQDGASVPRQTALQKRNGCGSPNPCDAWTDMTVEVVTTELKTKEKIRWRTTVVQSTQTIVKTSRRKIKTVIKVPAAETPQHPDYPPPNPAPTTYQGDGKLWKAMRKCVDEPPYAPYVRLRYGPRNVVDRVQGGSQLDIKGCGPDLAQTWPGKEVWTYDERAARSLAKGAVIKCQTFILHHIVRR